MPLDLCLGIRAMVEEKVRIVSSRPHDTIIRNSEHMSSAYGSFWKLLHTHL